MLLIKFIFLIFFSFCIILLIPKNKILIIKKISLLLSLIIFFFSLLILLKLDIYYPLFQYKKIFYIFLGINYAIGVDCISIFFIILTTLLIPICILVNWESVKYRFKDFTLLLFLLEFFLINIFLSLDIFFFYIFFEGVLIPMFFMISIWGARQRKIHAVYQFFFYTFFGSIFMLFAFLLIYLHVGLTDIELLRFIKFTDNRQILLWIFFFLAFAIKVPMMPFHIWLPEAHVEAPTTGSILLAGILLKLGTYGFIRFLIPLFPYGTKFFTPLVFLICIISIVYGSLSTIRQIDLKKIIAYSSIVHMNFAIIGLFSEKLEGIQGSFFLMISHGIISSALFFCIGILYDRYHTRILYYYGGLVQVMPLFAICFLIFILSNMGFPGTSGFIGEILIMMAIFTVNWKIALLLSLSMVFSGVYCLWLYNRLMFGEIRNFFFIKGNLYIYRKWFQCYADLTRREFYILWLLIFLNIALGLYPNIILNYTYLTILYIL